MANSSIGMKLPSLDDIFTTQEERDLNGRTKGRIVDVPLGQIDPFPDHPFEVRMDDDMDQLVESIKERGQITPAMVRQKPNGRYEMICGHRRAKACELAGLPTILAEVKEMDRDDAIVYMVDSNLQRTHILPSEKAKAYQMKLNAMNRKGHRTDLRACCKMKGFAAGPYLLKSENQNETRGGIVENSFKITKKKVQQHWPRKLFRHQTGSIDPFIFLRGHFL